VIGGETRAGGSLLILQTPGRTASAFIVSIDSRWLLAGLPAPGNISPPCSQRPNSI
jgi:hypothetical protein